MAAVTNDRSPVILPRVWDALYAEFGPRNYPGDYLYQKVSRMMRCDMRTACAEMQAAERRAASQRADNREAAVAVLKQSDLAAKTFAGADLSPRAWEDLALGLHRSQLADAA